MNVITIGYIKGGSLRLRDFRRKHELTQTWMSELMGMPQPAFARLESGARCLTRQHKCTLDALELLAENDLLLVLGGKIAAREIKERR